MRRSSVCSALRREDEGGLQLSAGGQREGRARLVLAVCSKRLRGSGHKLQYGKLPLDIRRICLH